MLVETNPDDYRALINGLAPRDFCLADAPIAGEAVLEMLAGVASQVRGAFEPVSWLIIEGNELVGMCSVVRPPQNGVVDIGYGIAPSRQGRGVATRAVAELIAWAQGDDRVVALAAETAIDNIASQTVLARNGFSQVGARVDDEDGALICWRRDTGSAPG